MGKDKRLWRKLVKKLRRKKNRQKYAQSLLDKSPDEGDDDSSTNEHHAVIDSDNDEVEPDDKYFLRSSEWEERERQAELAATIKQIEDERKARIEAENQRKIREEWEAKQEEEKRVKEEKERLEQLMKEKQEAEFNEFLSFLSGDIETPPTKYLLPDTVPDEENVCFYFSRTAACRFYDRCTKLHPRPTLSTAILFPNFFSHFKLEQSTRDEYDSDLGLEYEDKELHQEFIDFYEDVVPELRKCGTLVQFKVCCNLEPHLRGNVYVQYQTIKESVEAFRKFNGRFYNGRQLSLQFIKMDSWRSAICGSFLRKACVKGRSCNYLHVFRNPTKEFVKADHDWKEVSKHHASVNSGTIAPRACTSNFHSTSQSNSASHLKAAIQTDLTEPNNQSNKTVEISLTGSVSNSGNNVESSSQASHGRKRSRSSSSIAKRKKKDKKEKKKSKKVKRHKKRSKKHHKTRDS